MLIFYLHAWCKGSIFKKQVCILGSGVSLKIGIRFLKHQTHPKMRWDLSLKCSAVSRKVGFFIHFFTMGQNFQIQKTVEKCHTLKISTLPKFWISTSVVADGQFQTCTVQTWGCDWSGFKKDPLQDAERVRGHLRWGILNFPFWHRDCARFQFFCWHDIHLYSMHIGTLGHWVFFDIVYFGSGLIWYPRILSNKFSWTSIA